MEKNQFRVLNTPLPLLRIAAASAVFSLVSLLAACGGGGEPAPGSASAPVSQASPDGATAEVVNTYALAASNGSRTFVHPGVGLTARDLDAVKANLTKKPWASGYQFLGWDSKVSLTYKQNTPCVTVSRNPDTCRTEWEADSNAAYGMTLMWWFTGKDEWAQKAHDILISWAKVHKSFAGAEAGIEAGGMASSYITAADILRGKWSKWTSTDTSTIQTYLSTAVWPTVGIPGPVMSGSQGMPQIEGALAVAIFNDDSTKFDQALQALLSDAGAGLLSTLPNGEVVDTGRDQGHAFYYTSELAWVGEMLWQQGVDVFSLMDNRILAVSEYYARYNLQTSGTPKIPYVPMGGPAFGVFSSVGSDYLNSTQNRRTSNIILSHYGMRKGLALPLTQMRRENEKEDQWSFVYLKPTDTVSTATKPDLTTVPTSTWVTKGLTSLDMNGNKPAGSSSYGQGIWTLKAGWNGTDPYWQDSDGIHFAYKALSGDFSVVTKVTSLSSGADAEAKAGLMFRDKLDKTTQRIWLAAKPGNKVERNVKGSTNLAYSPNGETKETSVPSLPVWLRMQRVGQRITTFISTDGASWAPSVVADFPNLPSTIYVGLFANSHKNGTAMTATFADLRMTGGDGGGALQTPPAPLSVYAAADAGRVVLRWDSALDAQKYNLKRSTSQSGPFSTIATVANNEYVDTGVSNGTTYYYVVTATNTAGESGNSQGDHATPMDAVADVGQNCVANTASGGSNGDGAFDDNSQGGWTVSNTTTAWLQCDLGAGQAVVSYAITSDVNQETWDPKDWQLQGSNDAKGWTTLDSRKAETFPYRLLAKYYTVASPTSYRYYRLNVTAVNGGSDFHLGAVHLYAKKGRVVADGTYRLTSRWFHKVLASLQGGLTTSDYKIGQSSQGWTFTDTGGGSYKITDASGNALSLSSASAAGWTDLKLLADKGANYQRWYLAAAGTGYFNLVSASSGQAATAPYNGTGVIQAPNKSTDNQQWSITKLP